MRVNEFSRVPSPPSPFIPHHLSTAPQPLTSPAPASQQPHPAWQQQPRQQQHGLPPHCRQLHLLLLLGPVVLPHQLPCHHPLPHSPHSLTPLTAAAAAPEDLPLTLTHCLTPPAAAVAVPRYLHLHHPPPPPVVHCCLMMGTAAAAAAAAVGVLVVALLLLLLVE